MNTKPDAIQLSWKAKWMGHNGNYSTLGSTRKLGKFLHLHSMLMTRTASCMNFSLSVVGAGVKCITGRNLSILCGLFGD